MTTALLILIGLTIFLAVYRATEKRDDLPIEPGRLVRVIQYQPTRVAWALWTRWPRISQWRALSSFEGRIGHIDELGRFEVVLSDGGSVILDVHDPSLRIIPLDAIPAEAKGKRGLNS